MTKMISQISKVALMSVFGFMAGMAIFIIYSPQAVALERHVYPAESIQAAISEAGSGDVIIIHQGVYPGNIDFPGQAITIKSTDPNDPLVVSATVINGMVRFASQDGSSSLLKGVKRDFRNCLCFFLFSHYNQLLYHR